MQNSPSRAKINRHQASIRVPVTTPAAARTAGLLSGLWLVLSLIFAASPAVAAPSPAAVNALLHDVRKLVAFSEQRGWAIDHYEIQRVLPDVLLSVCRSTPAVRRAAAEQIARAIAANGGSSRGQWQRNGHDIDALSDVVSLERAAALLSAARTQAKQQCPYWMTPQTIFRGYQFDMDHTTLNVEGGGLFSLRKARNRWQIGGGGSGRITLALPLTSRWKLRIGPEVGGAALVDQSLSSDRVSVDFVTAIPLTLRHFSDLYLYDIEVAPLAFGLWWREPLRYGVRVGGLFGISAPRVRAFLPWTGIAMGVEWLPAQAGRQAQWTLRMGLRVGFAWRIGR